MMTKQEKEFLRRHKELKRRNEELIEKMEEAKENPYIPGSSISRWEALAICAKEIDRDAVQLTKEMDEYAEQQKTLDKIGRIILIVVFAPIYLIYCTLKAMVKDADPGYNRRNRGW